MNTGRKGGGGSDSTDGAPASRKLASGFIAGLRCGEVVRVVIGKADSGVVPPRIPPKLLKQSISQL